MRLCWNVHGSGATGIANIAAEHFPFVGGRAYREAARFATVVAEVVALHAGCQDETAFRRLAEQVTEAKVKVYLGHLPDLAR